LNLIEFIYEILSSPYEMLSVVLQECVLGPLLFGVFVDDLCDVIKCSTYLLSADDIKMYSAIKSPKDYDLLKSDMDSGGSSCTANSIKFNISKTSFIPFSRKSDILIYEYVLCQSSTTRTASIEELGVFLESKLNFHKHVHCFSKN
jgi:hypothetical protein